MTRLSGRVRKLEGKIRSPRFVDFGVVYQAALKKLSSCERDLLAEIMAYRADRNKEPHQAAWNNLQVAIREAAKEKRAPNSICVLILGRDLLL